MRKGDGLLGLVLVSLFVLLICWAMRIGAEAIDIYNNGFLECFETTNFHGNEMLCVKKGE